MHIFISAGEPSGDIHGSNLIRALRHRDPTIRISGFGGERMEAAGAKLLYPLTKLAVMWFLRTFLNIITFIRLAWRAKRFFRYQRPDAVVLIDFPGFHFALAKRAPFWVFRSTTSFLRNFGPGEAGESRKCTNG